MKKILISLIALAVVVSIAPVMSAKAEDALSARVLNRNKDIVYRVFNEPSDIEYSDEGLYIRSSDGYEIFDGKNFIHSDISADSVAILSGGVATLSQGKLKYGNLTADGEFSLVSAYKNKLVASNGKVIRSFDCSNGDLAEQAEFVANSDVILLAATETGNMYAVSRTGYTDIFVGNELLCSLRERVLGLAFSNNGSTDNYYILTSTKMILYCGLWSTPVEKAAPEGATDLTVGDGAYVLTVTGAIYRYRQDLSDFVVISASSGNFDWFYEMPVGVDTKMQSIYVPDQSLGRVAVITGDEIMYIDDLSSPVAATADNRGYVYVAYGKNTVGKFVKTGTQDNSIGGSATYFYTLTDEIEISNASGAQNGDRIVDVELDSDGVLYCLMGNGDVIANGTVIRKNVKAMKFLSTMHYHYKNEDGVEYIDDIPLSATDFAVDLMGNIFAVNGNKVIAATGDGTKEYVISNAGDLISIAISKVDSDSISYGDLVMVDKTNMCVLTLDGDEVGSANAKMLFDPPELTSVPNPQAEGRVGLAKGTIIFTLPIEGEIAYEAKSDERIILLEEGDAPDPFVYCAADVTDENGSRKLVKGYAYKNAIDILPYTQPQYNEAKINIDNTPVYKYPSVNSPMIGELNKNEAVHVLPFAVTSTDEYDNSIDPQKIWYTDAYNYKWHRIAYGDNEGFIIASAASAEFFTGKEEDMPQFNATVIEDAALYRYDSASDTYVKFESLGDILKDTRVKVETPFDASVPYTKIVFYRAGYGVVDADCYVETKYVRFDGVDIVKIVAVCVIILATIILIIVIVRRYKIRRLNRSHSTTPDDRQ